MLDRLIRMRKDERGFTLIELIMVIVILAILLALALPAYLGTRKKAYLAEAQENLQEMRTSAWLYYVERNTFEGFNGQPAATTANWSFEYGTGDAESITMTATGRDGSPVADATVTLTLYNTGAATLTSSGF
ncbi:MAG: prepilin-type N-terminal cleavage/methylation domain-containing protein [Armatimonadota bacterium]|nr:prepilin-type N-terminal cleavage/methylation domain-containing protein [Armatimonadota bacterium]